MIKMVNKGFLCFGDKIFNIVWNCWGDVCLDGDNFGYFFFLIDLLVE